MIKVERVWRDPEATTKNEDCTATVDGILSQIFGTKPTDAAFEPLSEGSWRSRTTGILIESGSYGNNKMRLRVMIKREEIDDVKIKAKYLEVQKHAQADAALWKQVREQADKRDKAFEGLLKELGIAPRDSWNSGVSSRSENTVKIFGEVGGQTLKAISEVLGRDFKLHFEEVVPIAQAKQVYRLIYPVKKGESCQS